jgi:hypothetical protein
MRSLSHFPHRPHSKPRPCLSPRMRGKKNSVKTLRVALENPSAPSAIRIGVRGQRECDLFWSWSVTLVYNLAPQG